MAERRTPTGTQPEAAEVPRFWCRLQDGCILDDAGYLMDPEALFLGHSRNPAAIPTDRLAQDRVVVLLGEPGIGKSRVLYERGPLLAGDTGPVPVVWRDLASLSENRLIREVLEGPEVCEWLARDVGELCLVLDSVDEARTRIEHLPALLGEYFGKWPMQRLIIRLACRTAEWPSKLHKALADRYGAEPTVVELLPLRRRDIAEVVGDLVDPEAFLSEAEARAAVPFVTRPLTARMLARSFKDTGSLPDRVAEIYRRALLSLCDEVDPDRWERRISATSASQRLAVARRIAAITVFGGRLAVWSGPLPERHRLDVTIDECCGGREPLEGAAIEVTEKVIRSTLRTGLFTGRGSSRLGWAHATFADYLTADWLITNRLSHKQIASLLLAPDGKLYRQVRLTAAWAVSIDPDRMGWLVEADPEAFVGEVDVPNPELRAAIVTSLFDLANADLWRPEWGTRYRNLAYPGLADQVRLRLSDDSDQARRLAIDLAIDCGLTALQPDLVAIALDLNRTVGERSIAARAVERITQHAPSDDLLPLINDPAILGEDPEDQLLGAALLALWPHALPTTQALHHVRIPKRRNLHGSYAVFLFILAQSLTSQDLPAAMAWLDEHATGAPYQLAPLVNAIVRLALQHLEDAEVLDVLVGYARRRAAEHQPLLLSGRGDEREGPIPDEQRRRLAIAALADGSDTTLSGVVEYGGGHGLLSDRDFLWLVDLYLTADPATRRSLARAADWLFRSDNRTHVNAVLELPEDHPLRRDVTGAWLEPIRLDAPETVALREQWQRIRSRRHRDQPDDAPEVDEWILRHLDGAESGDLSQFWQALRLLTVPPGVRQYRDEFQPDLTAHSRWKSLSDTVQNRLLEAALRYVREGECNPDEWLDQEVRYFPAEAGYRALMLILRLAPHELDTLPPEVWRRWAPILVAWPVAVDGAAWDDKLLLLQHATPHAMQELTDALLRVIRRDTRAGKRFFAEEESAFLWTSDLAIELLDLAIQAATPDPPRADLLELLAQHQPGLVRPTLLQRLTPAAIDADPDAGIIALRLLLAYDDTAAWPTIKLLLNERTAFAADALLGSVDVVGRKTPDLSAAELAELYLWLQDQFPSAADPEFDDVHFVGPRESIGRWRDAILRRLQTLGTSEAVEALAWLANAAPQHRWLPRVLAAAQDQARTARWTPVPVDQLRRLAGHADRRLVRSSEELLDLTTHALDLIQQRLQGQTPEAHLLWDTTSRRPKLENELSNYLRHRLADLLGGQAVTVNREVEVRPTHPTGIGERTDLQVIATAGGPAGHEPLHAVTIVGEVKGAWNSDIRTTMRAQLVDRYMRDIGTRHGLYIVAWFDSSTWDPEDPRRARAARWPTRANLLQELKASAADLRAEGIEVIPVVLDCSYQRPLS